MNLLRFAVRRVAEMAATLLAASFVVFGAMYLAPGNPASFLLTGRSASPEAVAAINAQYHLDDPFAVRYLRWLGDMAQGDFGRSLTYRTDVSRLIADRLPTTLLLIAMALTVVVTVGLLLGRIAAVRGGATDTAVLISTTIAVGTPSFVAAVLLQGLFAVKLGWFPSSGSRRRLPRHSVASHAPGRGPRSLPDRHARPGHPLRDARSPRRRARHRRPQPGVPERHVIRRHVMRNALGTVLTTGGLIVSTLLVCTILVETAFSVGGIGQLLELATSTKDFPTVQAISLIIVALFMTVNLIVDLLLPVVDPRITLGARGASA